MRNRHAFTLVEILVVITILGLLTGLLTPVVTQALDRADRVECTNKLKGIGQGIILWRVEVRRPGQEIFPDALTKPLTSNPHLRTSLSETAGGAPADYVSNKELWTCPADPDAGANPNMGRDVFVTSGDYHSDIYQNDCSYMYEVSGEPCGFSRGSNAAPAGQTWAQYKVWQHKHGNFNKPFPSDKMPILRCFHHHEWNSNRSAAHEVINLSWSLVAFDSQPYWENDVDELHIAP